MTVNAIITAGGTSSRFGNSNKLLEKINGKEVIKYTIEAFLSSNIDKIIICANISIIEILEKMFNCEPRIKIVEGGITRQESVYNGLKFEKSDYVLIHDGARPIISPELINICIEMVKEHCAISVMTKTIDTIKEVENGKIRRTIDRAKLYNTQTPQGFKYNLILDAHKKFVGKNYTDDAGMIEDMELPVYVVDGSYRNIKITTQSDIELAQIYLSC